MTKFLKNAKICFLATGPSVINVYSNGGASYIFTKTCWPRHFKYRKFNARPYKSSLSAKKL